MLSLPRKSDTEMHEFDFINRPKGLLTPEIVGLLTRLHECRGRQDRAPVHPTASKASTPPTSASAP